MNKIKPIIIITIIFWIVFLVDNRLSLGLARYGIAPRNIIGLRGIIFSPFLHGSFYHIVSNTVPFLVLGSILFIFYNETAYKVLIFATLLTGLGIWIFARPALHIGISGLIYALATFIVFAGFYKRNFLSIIISVLVIVAYGGLIWGLLPGKVHVSFEGHIAGAVAGIVLAGAYYKRK